MRISKLKLFFILSLFTILSFLRAGDKNIGDSSDGSRIKRVHLIKLFDSEGNHVFPVNPSVPFSTRQTCAGECHSYSKIRRGFHFNLNGKDSVKSRTGEPWIYTDPTTLSMIPLSFRKKDGAFNPEEIGLHNLQFITRFGPFYAGGDVGEIDSLQNPENYFRWEVSGKMEINCLLCHDANPRYDLAEYGSNIRRQNFKWAAAASGSLAEFEGNASAMPDNFDPYDYNALQGIDTRATKPPRINYRPTVFNSKNQVYFDIVKETPDERCYYCHSSVQGSPGKYPRSGDGDIHLKAGLKCVDCHNNDINHNMLRGDTPEMSCAGCHTKGNPESGRLGATIAGHEGIPPVHLDKLACTACHSGEIDHSKPVYTKTSRNHFLGLHGTNKRAEVFPHIQSAVLARPSDGLLVPAHIFWPSFWAKTNSDGTITPLPVKFTEKIIRPLIGLDSLKNFGEWPAVSDSAIAATLDTIPKLNPEIKRPLFITGGLIYKTENGKLVSSEYRGGKGFAWQFAHPVRPAAQALGANGCRDCHSPGASFYRSEISVESSLKSAQGKTVSQSSLMGFSLFYQNLFSLTFYFRPVLKGILLISVFFIFIVLSGYLFSGVKSFTEKFIENNEEGKK
jgi:hypothetical protein